MEKNGALRQCDTAVPIKINILLEIMITSEIICNFEYGCLSFKGLIWDV